MDTAHIWIGVKTPSHDLQAFLPTSHVSLLHWGKPILENAQIMSRLKRYFYINDHLEKLMFDELKHWAGTQGMC